MPLSILNQGTGPVGLAVAGADEAEPAEELEPLDDLEPYDENEPAEDAGEDGNEEPGA